MTVSTLNMTDFANLFKLLGHESRLTMLKILTERECCVCEFVELFQMSQPAISQHLRKLKDIGLIEEERREQWVYYSLNLTSQFYPLLIDLLKALPDQDEKLNLLENKRQEMNC